MIKFAHTIVFVRDMEASKQFYTGLLEQEIEKDCGVFVLFKNGFALHEAKALCRTIYKTEEFDDPCARGQGGRNLLVYFESNRLEDCCKRLVQAGVEIIHLPERQQWGQTVMRFYDPDRHIVEIGEAMDLTFE